MNWQLSQQFDLKMRAECSNYTFKNHSEYGWLFYADVNFHPSQKISIATRFAWYNTENYSTRVYMYENDVPLYFYIPAFYSNGIRYYFYMKYKITSNLSAYIKFSQSRYLTADETFGSGNSEIDGSYRSNFRIHIKYRF